MQDSKEKEKESWGPREKAIQNSQDKKNLTIFRTARKSIQKDHEKIIQNPGDHEKKRQIKNLSKLFLSIVKHLLNKTTVK